MANKYSEIVKIVESQDSFREDMGHALELVREHFHTRYMKRIKSAIETERQKTLASPPREVALLAALKQFAPQPQRESYDKLSDMLVTLCCLQDFKESASDQRMLAQGTNAHKAPEVSLHQDGVYDIDHECSSSARPGNSRFAELIFLLAVLWK